MEAAHSLSATDLPVLSSAEWRRRKQDHVVRVEQWASGRVARATRAEWHPVYEFLFDYYSYRPSHLMRWSPGFNVVLSECSATDLDWPDDFVACDGGYVIPGKTFPQHRVEFLKWAIRYLQGIAERAPSFCCFGLHEWAMVYQIDTPRHSKVPLRLSTSEISEIVERSEIRCTHYDAFRFFTPTAVPLNKTKLTRETTAEFDQRGCIHVTMDLYKFANKIAPWCSSELIADAFMLAVAAREIDMRASPYDLRDYGFQPILIETAEGREEYVREQRRLSEVAVPIRARLIETYRTLLADCS